MKNNLSFYLFVYTNITHLPAFKGKEKCKINIRILRKSCWQNNNAMI